jgi:hypothetical protein
VRKPFEVIVALSVARAFLALPRRSRAKIEAWLDHLSRNPAVEGDFVDPDRKDRVHQVKLVGDCLVTWWVDELGREVRVVAIDRVEDE